MKKHWVLLPTIITCASIPCISIVGCGDGENYPDIININMSHFEVSGPQGCIVSEEFNLAKGGLIVATVTFSEWTSAKIPAFIEILNGPDYGHQWVPLQENAVIQINQYELIPNDDFIYKHDYSADVCNDIRLSYFQGEGGEAIFQTSDVFVLTLRVNQKVKHGTLIVKTTAG